LRGGDCALNGCTSAGSTSRNLGGVGVKNPKQLIRPGTPTRKLGQEVVAVVKRGDGGVKKNEIKTSARENATRGIELRSVFYVGGTPINESMREGDEKKKAPRKKRDWSKEEEILTHWKKKRKLVLEISGRSHKNRRRKEGESRPLVSLKTVCP